MKRLIMSFFAVLMMMCIVKPVMALEIEPQDFSLMEATSGSCGQNVTWSLNDGVMTISGTGEMYNSCLTDDRIKTVIIEEGVTNVGVTAFRDCTTLQNVTIPNSVKTIGGYAFSSCTNLQKVDLPSSVVTIERDAFSYTGISYFIAPEELTTITGEAFSNCSNLKTVYLGSSLQEVGYTAFRNCNSITDVFYDGTYEEWRTLFYNNSSLELENANKHFNTNTVVDYEDGSMAFSSDGEWYCLVNGETHKSEEVIIPEVPASCTETGLSEGKKCSVCGKILEAQEEIPALGHFYADGVCTRCGDVYHSNGWEKDPKGIWHYYENNVAATGWKKIDGSWYMFNDRGEMLTSWQKSGSTWYYLQSSGAMATDWQQISGKWYFFNESGAMVTDWRNVGGKWYFFNGSGAMQTGWQSIGGKWYYFNGSGAMQTGWQSIGGKWYYFNGSGAMQTGWQSIGGKWYYFNGSGAMQTGWQSIDGKWYYFSGSGAMQTGWQSIDGEWYYFNGSGAMLTGWQSIDGKWYYFNGAGVWEEQSSGGSGGYDTGTTSFVLNINSHVIHSANCPSVRRMNESNKRYVTGTRSEVLAQYPGYSICNNCNAY